MATWWVANLKKFLHAWQNQWALLTHECSESLCLVTYDTLFLSCCRQKNYLKLGSMEDPTTWIFWLIGTNIGPSGPSHLPFSSVTHSWPQNYSEGFQLPNFHRTVREKEKCLSGSFPQKLVTGCQYSDQGCDLVISATKLLGDVTDSLHSVFVWLF